MRTTLNTILRAAARSLSLLAITAVLAASAAQAVDLVVEGNLTVEQDAQVDGDLTVGGQITAGSGAHVLTNAAGLIDGAKIQTGTLDAAQLATGAVTVTKLGTDSVTSDKVAADAIGSSELAPDSVTASEIAADAVGASEIAGSAVGSSEIVTGAVGSDEIATDAVDSAEIAANAVKASEIAADAVGASELIETDDYTLDELYVTTKEGIGTSTVPHGAVGYAKLALDGTDQSSAGPHIQCTTDYDDYPLMAFMPWQHDNMSIRLDCYWNGAQKSSDAGSNVMIFKVDDVLKLKYATGFAAGTTMTTISSACEVNLTDGSVKLPQVYGDTVGGTYRDLYIDDTGKLGYYSSSIRYKENVRDATEEDTGWIHALRPVMFDFKDPAMGTNQCGLIAEEVAEVHPAIVSYQRDLTYVDAGPSEEDPANHAGATVPVITTTDVPETVNYPDLVVPMLAEIQRLKKQVETLETRLAALEANE